MKELLKALLRAGKTAQAFEQLEQTAIPDADLQKQIIVLSARFETMKMQNRLGTADHATLDMQRNQINLALLELIDQLEPPNPPATTPNQSVKGNKATKSIVQNADKIYNIERIDNAHFS
jgi:hypothetical protein